MSEALFPNEIPANTYKYQPNSIKTLGADALLMCRSNLDEDLVIQIEKSLFDNIGDLLYGHAKAQDIRFDRAFKGIDDELSVEFHSGGRKRRNCSF